MGLSNTGYTHRFTHTLNALLQNQYKDVILTNSIGNHLFCEVIRDGYNGLITHTGIALLTLSSYGFVEN